MSDKTAIRGEIEESSDTVLHANRNNISTVPSLQYECVYEIGVFSQTPPTNETNYKIWTTVQQRR